jgi:hypothetical protein
MANLSTSANDIDRTSIMRAIVMNNIDPNLEGRVQLLIPKIMIKFDPNSTKPIESKNEINTNLIQNKDFASSVSNTVKSSNYIWARPEFLNNYEVPYINQVVHCYFEDGDPQKCYYKYSAPTLNSEVIEFKNVKSAKSKLSKETRPQIKVFFESPKDNTIHYYDENQQSKRYAITFDSGYSISINENPDEGNIELITNSKHVIRLDQKDEHILIKSHSGHFVILQDKEEHITAKTKGGHYIILHDSENHITTKTKGGHSLILHDSENHISAKTKGGHLVKMNDSSTDITLQASTGDKCYLGNDSVQLTSKSGDVIKGGGGITQMTASSGGSVTCGGGSVSLN